MNDFSATSRIKLRWLLPFRNYLTPAILWTAIAGICSVLFISITWLVTTQSDIKELRGKVTDLNGQAELLHKIDTQLAVMNSKMDDIAAEVDRQREWRDRIEGIADLPPHARHKAPH